MDVALCYESVLPQRGGCETYITDLARRLALDGHRVHLYACRWDADALPSSTVFHALPNPGGLRFLRPWRFAASCAAALADARHDVTMGFDKTYGQDILYPQGGLHVASAAHNLLKHRGLFERGIAAVAKWFDLAGASFRRLERRQYLGDDEPFVLVNSRMVQRHCAEYYDLPPERVKVLYSAIDPERFTAEDRPRRRAETRDAWGISPRTQVPLFLAMNYRLKGLAPLLRALRHIPAGDWKLVVAGDPRVASWQRLAASLGVADRVHFSGFCAAARNAYFAADFLVHPTFYDPCSLVVLEARACGLPVVTSRYNGASELLDPPHDGHVVADPHDEQRLAVALADLLDPTRRATCAAHVRRTAAKWTFEQHYQQLLGYFREVANRKRVA